MPCWLWETDWSRPTLHQAANAKSNERQASSQGFPPQPTFAVQCTCSERRLPAVSSHHWDTTDTQ